MTPDFKILAAGIDITSQIKDRLISLSVSDEAGALSDAVELVLDDRDGVIEKPRAGAPLAVALGYKETFVMPMGIFIFDEWSPSGWPRQVVLRGKAAQLGGALKEQKSRSWDTMTLGEISEQIAAEQSLEPKVAAALKAVKYEHVDQTDESDIAFLNRLARDHDAMATVKGGALIVMPRGKGLTVSGLAMLPRPIGAATVLSYSATMANRDEWGAVEAYWHDRKSGKREAVKVGDATPIKKLRNPFASKAEAEAAAKGALDEAGRSNNTLSLSLLGDPSIAAGGRILVTGIRASVDGIWSVKSASHTISSAGYVTTIEAEVPS